MRHQKRSAKLGRTHSHRRAMIANMIKSLIYKGRVVTTLEKAKEVRRHAEKLVTLARTDSLAARRRASAKLMVRYNSLTPKQKRAGKDGENPHYNTDRRVLKVLFEEIAPRYTERPGGYTRIIRLGQRKGDSASQCILEYV